jgi:hypothetical protein
VSYFSSDVIYQFPSPQYTGIDVVYCDTISTDVGGAVEEIGVVAVVGLVERTGITIQVSI